MKNYFGYILVILLAMFGCSQSNKQVNSPETSLERIVTLDDKLLAGLHQVIVSQTPDIVFNRDLNYSAYPLSEVLIKAFPDWKELLAQDAVLIMRATGGYAPQMAFSDGFSGRAFIATNIEGRPTDQPYDCWQEGGEEHCDLGYYFIWTDGNYPERPQPWGTYELEVVQFEDVYGKIIPQTKDEVVLSGFETYQKYCLECHRINDLGGSKGTEHAQRPAPLQLETLKFFIFEYRKNNPSTYMPDFSEILKEKDANELMAYIDFMSKSP